MDWFSIRKNFHSTLNGDLRGNLKIMPTIFNFWGMLSGLIQLAANKEDYIHKTMGLSKIEFLNYGFHMLYSSIANKGECV